MNDDQVVSVDGGPRARSGVSSPASPCGLRRGSLRHDRLAEPKQAKAGGARRDRTADLVIANDALSQLSYGPLRDRLDASDGGQQSAPFTIRSNAKSRTAKSLLFGVICLQVPLFAREGTDI